MGIVHGWGDGEGGVLCWFGGVELGWGYCIYRMKVSKNMNKVKVHWTYRLFMMPPLFTPPYD